MARTGIIHHFGSFLLLVATVLLIIPDIAAPVVNELSLLEVTIKGGKYGDRDVVVNFGSWGWCEEHVTSTHSEHCSGSHVGYSPAVIIENLVPDIAYKEYARDTARGLTHAFVLHAVATGLAFLAFLTALGAGLVGSLLASLMSLLTFCVCVVALVVDFVGLGLVKAGVDEITGTYGNSHAKYGAAAWTTLAARPSLLSGGGGRKRVDDEREENIPTNVYDNDHNEEVDKRGEVDQSRNKQANWGLLST
ncbi:pali-domain-containing protein [Xylariaceae sp. FL0804]|nr:pali-domain-containing protein [Xylariaceae sp. FL0804]